MVIWLRIIVSSFCLVLCVLFAALWVRSYTFMDFVTYGKGTSETTIWSRYGDIRKQTCMDDPKWQPKSFHVYSGTRRISLNAGVSFGFYFDRFSRIDGFKQRAWQVPFWYAILPVAFITYLTKPAPRWKFGMRELFVLSTIGAIIVGSLAIFLRAISS